MARIKLPVMAKTNPAWIIQWPIITMGHTKTSLSLGFLVSDMYWPCRGKSARKCPTIRTKKVVIRRSTPSGMRRESMGRA
jgi:hypothetical protein